MAELYTYLIIGLEVALTIALVALLSLRMKVNARASIHVNAKPERLWQILNPYDGKCDNWGRTKVVSQLLKASPETYEMHYTTTQHNGVEHQVKAQFEVVTRDELKHIFLLRAGLEGRSTNNELLEIEHKITPEGSGSRLSTRYLWGKRMMLAQLLARTDLLAGAYRLKGLAETGKPNERAFWLISGAVALVTMLISILAFALLADWLLAVVLVFALLVHEFGHLVAFRMIGQPWGRLMFLPFLGAIAMPRLPFRKQWHSVFSALMGPGFSLLFAAACLIPGLLQWQMSKGFAAVGATLAILNAFNMLPAEPLDGGVALRSVLARMIGARAWAGLMGVGLGISCIGLILGQPALIVFGALAIAANMRSRKIDEGLAPLTSVQVGIAILCYVAITSAHYTMFMHFLNQLAQ